MVEFSYDEDARAVYVGMRTANHLMRKLVSETERVCEDPIINVDYWHNGRLCGIEIILPEQK